IFCRRLRDTMRIDNAPAVSGQSRFLRIVVIDIHRELKLCVWNAPGKIEITLKGKFLRQIWKSSIHLYVSAPIPLADGGERRHSRARLLPEKFCVNQRAKRFPLQPRFRQAAIAPVNVEPDRPKFVMMRLTHLQLCHPIKNFTRIEIAKNPALELKEKRRMKRVTE